MQKLNLPPVMDSDHPLAEFVSARDVMNIQKATGGNSKQMQRTSIAVFSEGLEEVESQLRATGFQVEFAKLGSYRMQYRADIVDLIEMLQRYNVRPHLGGQMIESAIKNGLSSKKIADSLSKMNLTTVEISNSGNDINGKTLDNLTQDLAKDFCVIREVGNKTDAKSTLREMEDDLKRALDSEAQRVVIEGGGSGNTFIYDHRGRIKILLLHRLLEIADAKKHGERVMVETPRQHQREYMLMIQGWKSRLANVRVNDLQMALEERVIATGGAIQYVSTITKAKIKILLQDIIDHCEQCTKHDVNTLFNDMVVHDPIGPEGISLMREKIINHQQEVKQPDLPPFNDIFMQLFQNP